MFDATQKLQNAGAVTSSAAGSSIVDLMAGCAAGSPVGRRAGKIVIDISALTISTNDDVFDIVAQGSNSATFATASGIIELAAINVGHKTPKRTDSDRDDAVGRRSILFENVDEAGNAYRYLRLYIVAAGSTKSINFTAYHVPLNPIAA
jgi:hypothetical protein